MGLVPKHAFGLAVYGDFIYWTDWIHRGVLRVNKYTGTDFYWLKKNIPRQPMGIVAVAPDTDDCKHPIKQYKRSHATYRKVKGIVSRWSISS